jgi:hypothetical protein
MVTSKSTAHNGVPRRAAWRSGANPFIEILAEMLAERTYVRYTGVVVDQVPLEHLEAQITQLAGHRSAATCRWLLLVAEFDRRQGHARWECRSTAHWLNWHCGVSFPAGREHVRVARALEALPRTTDAFAAGRLSYSKVRAITRVATPATEQTLLDWAQHATAAQLDRIVAGRQTVERNAAQELTAARHVTASYHDDGSVVGSFRLDPEEGAAWFAALTRGKDLLRSAAESELEGKGAPAGVPRVTNADALVLMVETMLAADRTAAISRHERTLVMVHVSEDLAAGHLHDGPALCADSLRRVTCDAPICAVLHRGKEVLDLGRTTREPSRAQRRALMARDGGCRFPGCAESRYVEAHHVRHWTDGGPTDLDNLVLLCWRHHHAVHEGGYAIALDAGAVTVRRRDGSVLATESVLVPTGPGIVEQHEARGLHITPDSVVAKWDGRHPNYPDAVEGLCWLEDRYHREVLANEALAEQSI